MCCTLQERERERKRVRQNFFVFIYHAGINSFVFTAMHNFILHPGKAFAKSYRIQSEKSSLSSLPRVIFKSFRITRITCNIAFSRPSTLSFDCMSKACVIFSFTMNGFKLWTFVAVWYGLVAIVSDLYTFGADLRSTVNAASSSSSSFAFPLVSNIAFCIFPANLSTRNRPLLSATCTLLLLSFSQ